MSFGDADATRATDAGENEAVVLAFSFAALDALADPQAAVGNARSWSDQVGVVSDRPAHRVINRIRKYDVYEEDFYPQGDRSETLADVGSGTDADRYVYVGTTNEDAEIASRAGWEYRPIDEAARKAGWELSADPV